MKYVSDLVSQAELDSKFSYLPETKMKVANLELSDIKEDCFRILSAVPDEVPALIKAIDEGKIDGRVYTGRCACLIGTIANILNCYPHEIEGIDLDVTSPAERFFLLILPEDTPTTNPVSAMCKQWCEEFMATQTESEENA